MRIPIPQLFIWVTLSLCLSCAGRRQLQSVTVPLPAEKHPSLLFTADDIPTIRSRIDREPYTQWWRSVKRHADEALTVDCRNIPVERKRSEYAKALSFAFVVTGDSLYAEKAREMLESIIPIAEGGNWGDIHTEIDAVPNFCQAYDMLAPYLAHFPESHRKIRSKIYSEGHRLYTYASLKETANNWRIRRCAALGLCALTIADHGGEQWSNPKDWNASAIKGFMKTIDHQTTSDGGHAEGPNYLRYSADIYVPYLLSLYKTTGLNLYKTEVFEALHNWGIKIRLPNGQRPNVDDAALDGFYGGLFAGLSPDPPIHQWDWLFAEDSQFCPGLKKIDAICFVDDTIEPKRPEWNPTLFLPEAGTAIFRSDWTQDGVYMLLLGEHGKARLHGGAHDQPDPMSFIIYAFGEMLAIDSGYIKWSEREKVNKPRNHNLILVDEDGPSAPKWLFGWHGGTDAYLQNYFTSDFVDYAEVKTNYTGVDFVRSVFFPGHRYFIIVDDIRSDREHRYSWLLHGNGHSTDGTFALTDNGAVWTVKDVFLHAFLAAPAGVTFSEQEDIHSFNYDEELSHSLMKAEILAGDTLYLGVLYPRREIDGVPLVTPFTDQHLIGAKIEHDGSIDLILTRRGGETISYEDTDIALGSIRTDAAVSLISFENGRSRYTAVIDGTHFHLNDQIMFRSEDHITVALRREVGSIDGYIKGSGQYQLELFSDFQPDSVSFRSTPVDFHFDKANISFSLEGEGSIHITKRSG